MDRWSIHRSTAERDLSSAKQLIALECRASEVRVKEVIRNERIADKAEAAADAASASQRSRLASAALTILRAYVVAGRPSHGKPAKGSFEAWDRLVRGAVIWASCHDPCGGVDRIRKDGDLDRDRLRALTGAWWETFGDRDVTVVDLLARAPMAPELHTAIEAYAMPDVEMNATRLGQTLAKVRGRIVGDRSIEHAGGTAHGGARRWVVRGPE